MQRGVGLWRKLCLELRGLVGLFCGCSELDPMSGSTTDVDTHLLSHWPHLCRWKSLGNTHVDFQVCSSFPPLNNQTVVEFLEDWVAPLYRSRRQNVAVQSHTPTLLHMNRRDEDSLRDRIYILEAWLLCQLVVGGMWTDAFSSDEALASCWCQFCVPSNYCLVLLFRHYTNTLMEQYSCEHLDGTIFLRTPWWIISVCSRTSWAIGEVGMGCCFGRIPIFKSNTL